MEKVKAGRNIVIAIIVVMLLVDIVNIISAYFSYASNGEMQLAFASLRQGFFRFILTSLMFYFLYKGHRWAKWLSVVLFIIGGGMALLTVALRFSVLLLIVGILYIVISLLLILSKNVKQFFLYQRSE